MWLVDTNILVYAVSPAETVKCPAARSFLKDLMARGQAAVAVQNCAEFLSAAALKPKSPLEISDAMTILNAWVAHMRVLSPNFETVEMAVGCIDRYQLSFWDAMVWAVAVQEGLEGVYSEDGPVGATIGGIRWRDPLKDRPTGG